MKAVVVAPSADGTTLELRSVPNPTPLPNELLVAVRSAGINRTDLRRKQEHFTPATGELQIAGLEMAGEVIGIGNDVRGFAVGDRVLAMTKACYAEQTTVDYRVATRIPESLSFDEAAAIATVFPTAHDALVTNGQFKPGDVVLVQAATSAVGIAAVQIANALKAGLVIGTTGSDAKAALMQKFGLQHCINARTTDFAEAVKALTAGRGADVIIDNIGKGVLAGNIECAALGARIVSVGRMGGMTDVVDLDKLALKRLKLIGVTFRTRTIEQKAELFRRFQKDVFPLFEAGTIRPAIDRVFPLAAALEAQAYMASNAHLGKILLRPDDR